MAKEVQNAVKKLFAETLEPVEEGTWWCESCHNPHADGVRVPNCLRCGSTAATFVPEGE